MRDFFQSTAAFLGISGIALVLILSFGINAMLVSASVRDPFQETYAYSKNIQEGQGIYHAAAMASTRSDILQ